MLTVLESIKLSTEYLSSKGVESPRVNAELLLSHILKVTRLDLYLAFDKPLQEHEIIEYRNYLKRRVKFEPLQYILGDVEFYGLKFFIDKNVLIPRPETELLVEQVIKEYKQKESIRVLDIGTGSGNIAICIAKHFPFAKVTAIDIDEKSLEVAQKNALLHSVTDQITFLLIDIKNGKNNELGKFDIIVSNPPYVSLDDYETLQEEIRIYEPKYAITDYANGYKFYEIISGLASTLLNHNGSIYFEIGKTQCDGVCTILSKNGIKRISITKDYQQIERIIKGNIS